MTKVIFDCDTGVDDSLALLYLLSKPEVDLLGIVSTAGNVPGPQVVENNLGWLELLGRTDIEVFRGSDAPLSTPLMTTEETHGPFGVGYAELPADQQQVVVDFAGPALDKLPAGAPVEAVASAEAGSEIVERNVFKNDATGTWRMTLRIRRWYRVSRWAMMSALRKL